MHSIHYKILPEIYFNFIKVENTQYIPDTHQHSTRFATSSNYNQIKRKSEKGKRTLAFIGPRVWCEIPSDVKSISPGGFKTKYKNSLLQIYTQSWTALFRTLSSKSSKQRCPALCILWLELLCSCRVGGWSGHLTASGSRYDFPGVDHEGRQTCRFKNIRKALFHRKFLSSFLLILSQI